MGKDTVSIRIDKDMARFIQEYIEAHPELGYRTLSRFVDDVLRDKVISIKEGRECDEESQEHDKKNLPKR